MPLLRAGFTYFSLVFGAGFLLGAVLVLVLVPRLGARLAELSEMPLMAVVIVLAARHVLRRWPLPNATACLLVGGLALALLLAAELTLAALVEGQSPAHWIASLDPVSGPVYLAMLPVYALMPLVLRPAR
ncbi:MULTISPECIES: hypothetical protein [Aphanothece]|uniref:hypothetical protein n=1 Tax=Aphanothece TaxID=1121 RepID=UPI003984794E